MQRVPVEKEVNGMPSRLTIEITCFQIFQQKMLCGENK